MRRFYNTLLGTQALIDKAWLFENPSTDYIEIPADPSLSFTDGVNDLPFSISVELRVVDGFQRIFLSPSEYQLYLVSDRIWMDLGTTGNILRSISGVVMNSYRDVPINIIATYAGDKVTAPSIYLDGVLLATSPTNNSYTGMVYNPASPNTISDSNAEIHGKVKSVRIFDKQLSALEVMDVYNNNLISLSGNIISGWDDAGSTTDAVGGVLDNYGSNNGTLRNMTVASNVVDY